MPVPTLLAVVAAAAASSGGAGPYEVVAAGEGVRVHVAKRGLFSAFAHDHDFEVTRWRGTAELAEGEPARASLELVLAADSLRDREKGLSDDDRRKVEAQTAGAEILDAASHPEITYRSEGVTLEARSGAEPGPLRGTLHGRLTLRGRTRPLDVGFEAARDGETWRIRGSARFRQSDFGIKPFSGAAGTVGVKDQVEVRFAVALRPARAARAAEPNSPREGQGGGVSSPSSPSR